MKCWYPVCINKRKLVRTGIKIGDRQYGTLLSEKEDGSKILVPCGRCPACRRRKQNEWAYRIMEEVKNSKRSYFVTLTYDDDHLPISDLGIPTLDPEHLHTFFKNLRYNFPFRYFACGEYGDQFDRPHYHFILFYNGDLSFSDLKDFVEKRWIHGFIQMDDEPVGVGRAKYCAKYSMKQIGFDYEDAIPPFARMSRRPGIGKSFLTESVVRQFRKLNQWTVHDYQGTPYPLPRYYRESIYSKSECDEHSMLLEKVLFTVEDYEKIEFSNNNTGNFYESYSDGILNRERLFIKHLEKENYKFKYVKRKEKPLHCISSDDLISDEF